MQFSIRTMMALVGVAAIAVAIGVYWSRTDDVVSTDEFRWHDYAVGIVQGYSDGTLHHHGETTGAGCYITLREGEHYPGTTGGWYYQVGIQLPRSVSADDEFILRPAEAGRHLETVGSTGTLDKLGFLQPGEFVAFRFSNPFGDAMACDDPDSSGRLKVTAADDDYVTFHLKLKAQIADTHDVEIDRSYTLPRE